MGNYDEMLKRLRTYRKSIGLKQKQLGDIVGISQEQYSYLESGTIKITDDNLKALFGIGLDIDYLLTGKQYVYHEDELDEALNELRDQDRSFAMKMIAEIIVEKADRGNLRGLSEINRKNIRLLSAALQSWNNFSMINFIREDQGYSQLDMVQKLGIGIKKYREIERENRYPDAELLLDLYDMSGFQPMLFMNIYDRRLMAIKMIWTALGSEERKNILQMIKHINKII